MKLEDQIQTLKPLVRGPVIEPQDAGYDQARKVYNAMIDKRPRLIVQCADVADVIACVRFAREAGIVTAVRGGGHNGAGLGTCDDGVVIDLSRMHGVRVDPAARTVRAEAGYWAALHPYSAGGAYVNFMMEEGLERVKATYRGNFDRLATVKAKYDPGNLFRVNQNIRPER